MLLRKGVSLLSLLFMSSSWAYAQDTDLTRRSETSPRSSFLRAEIGTGYGVFNGVIIPDGVFPEEEEIGTTSHVGIPISIAGGWIGTYGSFRPSADLTYLKMLNTRYQNTNRETAAGYSRFELDLNGDYWISPNFAGSLLVLSRRNFYKNRTESHVLTTVMPGAGMKARWGMWETSIAGYYGAYVDYGFNNDTGIGSKSLGDTEAKAYGYEWQNLFRTSKKGRVTLGFQQENAEVTVNDVGQYGSYGFNISPIVPRSRTYELSTTILSLGFMKVL